MRLWHNLPWKWKLLVAFVSIIVCPMLITILIISERMEKRFEETQEQELLHRVDLVQNLLSKSQTEALRYVSLIQDNEELIQATYYAKLIGDKIGLEKVLQKIFTTLDTGELWDIDELAIYNVDKTLLAQVYNQGYSHPSPSLLIQQALAGQKLTTTAYEEDRNKFVIQAMGPLHSQEEVIAVVMVGFHLNGRFTRQFKEMTGAEFGLLYQGKMIVASHPGMQQQPWDLASFPSAKEVQIRRAVLIDGVPYIMAFTPLQDVQNRVIGLLAIGLDKTEGQRTITETRWVLFIVTILIMSLTVLISYKLAKVLARPVWELRKGVEKIRQGNLTHRLSIRGRDEMGKLALSFNQMTESLEEKTSRLERKNRELAVINAIATTASQSLHLDNILHEVLAQLLEVMEIDCGAVFLMDENQQKPVLRAHAGLSEQSISLTILKQAEEYVARIAQFDQPLVITNPERESNSSARSSNQENYPVIVHLPLQSKGKMLGVLSLCSKITRPIISQEFNLLIAIASQISMAIENAALYADLQHQMEKLQTTQIQLLQSEKMSALGKLISGVAHELNNPLTSVIGFAELLSSQYQADKKIYEGLMRIQQEATRAAKIVKNLLTFARQYKPERKVLSIHEVIEKTLELRAYEFKTHNIQVVKDFDSSLPATVGDFHQLQQVMLNLINNAEQAMLEAHGCGILTLKTRWVMPSDSHYGQPDSQTGHPLTPFIQISITDDGPGIPPKHLQRIFDPFFTTKTVGKGTGLGLSICYSIIQAHGGRIYATSHGKGTTFFIELPGQLDESLEEASRDEIPQRQVFSGKNILLVEDEATIQEVIQEILASWGCQVEPTGNGLEALEKLQQKDYDLIISDIYMPGASGRDLYHWLKEYHPELLQRIVFITGDTVSPENRRFLTETGVRYLGKPFSLREFTEIIQEELRKE